MPENYSVRPNKHVDREIFVELVGRILADEAIDEWAYVSMGGPQMADHIAMYRRNGVSKLYSFDISDDTVKRQKFNAPTGTTLCEKHTAADLPDKLNEIYEKLTVERLVVWLDYTGGKNRNRQLEEFHALLKSLSVGDVARISMDASLPSEKLKEQLAEKYRDDHMLAMNELVRREMGTLHPEDFELGSVNDMPRYLAKCVERVCDRITSEPGRGEICLRPLLLTSYYDSAPMFTATVVIQNVGHDPGAPKGFSFLAANWDSIESLEVPELTARERSYLDRILDRGPEEFNAELGYSIARPAQSERQWNSFKKFHRFLPQFQNVEIK